jgi:hypothetical protein
MKTLEVFLFVVFLVLVNSQSLVKFGLETFAEAELVAVEAIKEFLKQYFAVYDWSIDLIYCGSKSEALAEKLLLEKPLDVKMRVIKLDAVDRAQLAVSTIILFDSVEKYESSKKKLSWVVDEKENLNAFPNILFFVPKRRNLEFVEWLSSRSKHIEGANFLRVVNDKTVDLVTSFMFEPGKCREPQYKTINRFSRSNMKWDNETFFPEKYDNYNGCELYVLRDGIDSLTTRVFSILAEELKFKIKSTDIALVPDHDPYKYDLFDALVAQSWTMFQRYDFSPLIFTDVMTCTVPAGEPYTMLEKMFLMFDKLTWICIGVTLGGSLVVIQLINLMSIKIKNFVFGRDVRTPTLNLASTFLAGGQHRLPGRNFARFLLMSFIMWSVIIRTCYQSILYKNLQQDMRKPMIKTFDQLNENNFTIMVLKGAERLLGDEFMRR